jgi:hypothetical protein
MPTIPVPSNFTYSASPRDDQTPRGSMALHLKVALKRDALTRELAAGAPSTLSPELALRAAQLTSPRHRRLAANAWRRAIKDAHQPALTRAYYSLIRRNAVVDAEDSINTLIDRLRSDQPVRAQGMAILHLLVTNGMSSPLYNSAEAGALRHEITFATAALDDESTELPLAA